MFTEKLHRCNKGSLRAPPRFPGLVSNDMALTADTNIGYWMSPVSPRTSLLPQDRSRRPRCAESHLSIPLAHTVSLSSVFS